MQAEPPEAGYYPKRPYEDAGSGTSTGTGSSSQYKRPRDASMMYSQPKGKGKNADSYYSYYERTGRSGREGGPGPGTGPTPVPAPGDFEEEEEDIFLKLSEGTEPGTNGRGKEVASASAAKPGSVPGGRHLGGRVHLDGALYKKGHFPGYERDRPALESLRHHGHDFYRRLAGRLQVAVVRNPAAELPNRVPVQGQVRSAAHT
ncbi:hypothetical protein PMKS-000314 [Pichia membranifaciens]|uniref:Uncharacterized protein n=1 Tax=Pichia membranifaciens TaxID=4926 RepID=A0A1Q2YBE2_9ASCO|nr:hypothetical protein PMKS-000314 [Pichia membranifaciens]